MPMRRRGLLVVLSGPAGSGKSTLADMLEVRSPDICRSVTATTRAPREGETDGADYHFLDRDTFKHGIATGRFVEYNEFNGNLYGTPRDGLEKLLEQDKVVVLVIDVNGAVQIRKAFPRSVHFFLLPPTAEELRRRLCGRGTEPPADIEKRLAIAEREVKRVENYDFLVINDISETAAEDILTILKVVRTHHIRGGELTAWRKGLYANWHGDADA